ncbi:MAG: DUF4011 domain-containing protein, partial [Acidimicrobiales bacterium]
MGRWRDDLINLSRANRLLFFKHTKTASLEIVTPGSTTILTRLNASARANQWEFFFPASDEDGEGGPGNQKAPAPTELVVGNKDAKGIESALRTLERKNNQFFLDKGLWVLYLGLGELEWIDPAERTTAVHSPLVLVPVQFSRSSLNDQFRVRLGEDDVVFNPSLSVKMDNDFGITMPSLDDWNGTAIEEILDLVQAAVRQRTGWVARDRVVLTTFTFHKEAMYRDLLEHEGTIADHPMVQMLALGPDIPSALGFDFPDIPDDELDSHIHPEDLASIKDADSSQRRCIISARDGHSFVMDGPPGTGKSQTITNIIAELICIGKTVLFVSEKAAALEVVQKRLTESHLADFVLQLHSHNATRKAVAMELGAALKTRPTATSRFGQSDTARLIASRVALSNYAQAINETRQPLGRSLHQVLGRVARLGDVPQAPPPHLISTGLTADALNELLDQARVLAFNWAPVERGEDFLWRDLVDESLSASRHNELAGRCTWVTQAFANLQTASANACYQLHLSSPRDLGGAARLHSCLSLLEERPQITPTWLSAPTLDPVERRLTALEQTIGDHGRQIARLREIGGPSWHVVDRDPSVQVHEAHTSISRRLPELQLPTERPTASLAEAASFLEGSGDLVRTLHDDGRYLAGVLGVEADQLNLARIAQLAELATLVGVADRPEPEWLNPAVQEGLDRAVAILGELVSGFRQEQQKLASIFTPEVLSLDLVAIRARFAELHKGVGKLKSQYRRDKAELATCTVTGKLTKAALAQLDEAIAWAELARRLESAEQVHSALLGGHYYQRDTCD